MNQGTEMEVRAQDMRPGDTLCTDTEGFGRTPCLDSRINSRFIHEGAIRRMLDMYGDTPEQRAEFRVQTIRVEHVAWGFRKARIVLRGGVVMRYPRKLRVAVIRDNA